MLGEWAVEHGDRSFSLLESRPDLTESVPSGTKRRTAVLLFAREYERESKRYGLGRAGDRLAHEAMVCHVAETAGRACQRVDGAALLVAADGEVPTTARESARFEQVGDSFEARFRHAVRECVRRGYDRVVAIGGDHPDLERRDIERAIEPTSECKVTVGPADDGGVYLLGLPDDQLDLLDGLPWRSSRVFSQLAEHVHRRGLALRTLDPRRDVDSRGDAHAQHRRLVRLMRRYIGTDLRLPVADVRHSTSPLWPPSYTPRRTRRVRGPPRA